LPLGVLDAADLFDASERLLSSLYPAGSNHFVGPEAFDSDGSVLLGAFVGEKAVGCAGWVATFPGEAEVKRLFVTEGFRSRGLGRALMEALHRRAVDSGITVLRLETGIHQTESLNLYRSLDYVETPPFGDYFNDPLSVFMKKKLPGRQH